MGASRINDIIKSKITGKPYTKLPLSRLEKALLGIDTSGGGEEMKKYVVDVLPSTDIDENAIYLTPSRTPGYEDKYAEYTYINGKWEKLGVTPDGSGISYDKLDGKPSSISKDYIDSLFD